MTELGEFGLYMSIGITSLAIFVGPIGKAVARRIAGAGAAGLVTGETRAEFDELRGRMHDLEAECTRLADVEARLDFAERMLTQQRSAMALGDGAPE